jgi:hypothetical protein
VGARTSEVVTTFRSQILVSFPPLTSCYETQSSLRDLEARAPFSPALKVLGYFRMPLPGVRPNEVNSSR